MLLVGFVLLFLLCIVPCSPFGMMSLIRKHDPKATPLEWTPNSTVYDSKRCGLPLDKDSSSRGFVMGGKDAKEGKFPWAVALYRDNALYSQSGSQYICAGTLITKRHVMTAAHCFDSVPAACLPHNDSTVLQYHKIWLGGLCLPNSTAHCAVHKEVDSQNNKFFVRASMMSESQAIVRVTVGHYFVTGCKSGNDFALLELAEEVNPHMSNHICLPHRVNHRDDGVNETTDSQLIDSNNTSNHAIDWVEVAKPISIYGWGMDPANRSHLDYLEVHHLQVLELPSLLPANECLRSWNGSATSTRVPTDAICAVESLKQNTCAGDSGGGLITKHPSVTNNRSVLLGVLSEGTPCTLLAMPGDHKDTPPRTQIFTSVLAHADEIDSFIGME